MNDAPLEFATNKNQPPVVRETINESMDSERRTDKFDNRRDRDSRDSRDRRYIIEKINFSTIFFPKILNDYVYLV